MSSSKSPLRKAVFTSIWCISKSNAAPSATMHRMVVNLATGANVSLKSTPCTCENPLATNLALWRTISPAASLLVLNTHLHPTALRDLGRVVNSHVPLARREWYSSSMAASHLLASSHFNASPSVVGSCARATLAWSESFSFGRMWFFHHSPKGWLTLVDLRTPPSIRLPSTWVLVGALFSFFFFTPCLGFKGSPWLALAPSKSACSLVPPSPSTRGWSSQSLSSSP